MCECELSQRSQRDKGRMRVTYEITATVDEKLVGSYESYMREMHIPDLLATGFFSSATLSVSQPGRYRIRYEAADQIALDNYLATDAERLRADAMGHFPEGVDLEREIWNVIETFHS